MSASAGLSAAKRRRGGVQTKQPTPSVDSNLNNRNVTQSVDSPMDVRTLVLQHDFKIFQIEQALGHLMHQLDTIQQTQETAKADNNTDNVET